MTHNCWKFPQCVFVCVLSSDKSDSQSCHHVLLVNTSQKACCVSQIKKSSCAKGTTKPPFRLLTLVIIMADTSPSSCPRHTSLGHSVRKTGQLEKDSQQAPALSVQGQWARPWPSNSQRWCEGRTAMASHHGLAWWHSSTAWLEHYILYHCHVSVGIYDLLLNPHHRQVIIWFAPVEGSFLFEGRWQWRCHHYATWFCPPKSVKCLLQ